MTEHNNYALNDLLADADLLCYEHSMRTVLRLRDAMDVIYADEKDLSGIGMSRPEQKRLKAAYQKLFPKATIMGKLKKKILRKGDQKRVEIVPADQDQHVIPIERITLCRELGKGEFGSVFQAAWNTSGCANGDRVQVAVKCVSSEKLLANPSNFLQEAAIMHKMRHECVVRLFGVVLDTKTVMLVSELAPCGSLLECLQKPALRDSFFVDTLCDFAEQIAAGMEYLSNERLIHRDLAARNVLVFSADKVKISDFGLSRSLGMGEDYYRSEFSDGLRLPIAWCAPESINFLKFTTASDVWSYAVTLFEMFSYGQMPWEGCTGAEILTAIDYPRLQRLECPAACPSEMYKLMLQCWAHVPEERPSFTDILHQLPDIYPQALLTVCTCQDGVPDHLQFAKNEVILVLDKCPSAYPDGYYWSGCMRNGRTGLFRPADTVARLGAENPTGKLDFSTSLLNRALTSEKLNGCEKESKEKDKDKCKKKKLVISEPQGELRHTCHVGIDGSSFGLLQVDKNELARALPPSIIIPPNNNSNNNSQRRSPSVPVTPAPPLPLVSPNIGMPSSNSSHTNHISESPKPEVIPRMKSPSSSTHPISSNIPPPLPCAPKPIRSTPTPSAPPLSEPNSTCNTMLTSLPDSNATTNDSLLNEEQLLLSLARTHHARPAVGQVKYSAIEKGACNEGISWNAENSDGLIEEILNEMNTNITNFSISSTTSTSLDDYCDEKRPLLGNANMKVNQQQPNKSSTTNGGGSVASVCRLMSEAELEKWEEKVDREHRKADKRLEDERRKEITSWHQATRKEDAGTEDNSNTKSFSNALLTSTKAPPDWTEDAQKAYKLLVQCGDQLKSSKSPASSPVHSSSTSLNSSNPATNSSSPQKVSSPVQLRKHIGSTTPRPSVSPPPVPVVTTNVVSVTSFSSGDTTPSTSVAPVLSTPVTRSRIVASAPNGLPPPSNSTQKQQQQTTLLSSNRSHSSTQFANAALPPIPPQKSSYVVSFNAEASTCSQSTASALTSEDTSVISPLRQLRSQAGSVAHSFHTRSSQPAVPPPPMVDQQSSGRLPPPVPPKPKNKMNQSAPRTEQLRALSKDEIVSSAAKSPLFSRILPNEEVIKF